MFQKLYGLLERIDKNTRQQTIEASQTRIMIGDLGKEIALQNRFENSRDQTDRPKPYYPPSLLSDKRNALFLCLGIAFLLVFSYFTFRFLGINRQIWERTDRSVNIETYSYARYNELRARQLTMEAEVGRLDSLIQVERLSLAELKKLNETAVRTFIRIRRDLAKRDRQEITENK